MVTGWSYLVASNGVPASWNSCTRAFPREVTRSERCILAPDISGASGTVTGPSHSPARFFRVVKDFCASDGTAATEDFSALDFSMSDCAKATVESDIRTTDSIKRRDFMLDSPQYSLLNLGPDYSLHFAVVSNYLYTATHLIY